MPYHPPIPESKGGGKSNAKSTGLVNALIQAEKLMQIALVLPCAAFIGWLAGNWIGDRLHFPLAAAIGVAFGGAAGLFYVVRLALDQVKEPAKSGADPGADSGANSDKSKPNGKGQAGSGR